MSIKNSEIEKNIDKFNKYSEEIVNNIMDILEGKEHAVGIECLAVILVYLINGVGDVDERDSILNNLIDNLSKCLGKK